ncbi:MAG: glucokinase [Simkania sp.]|nr:glucokinase [Simkania sp.]
MLIAGDIGGTKTHLALYENERGKTPVFEKKFSSREYPGLTEIVQEFLNMSKLNVSLVDRACFGVAGPVVDRQCKTTNLPWMIDGAALEFSLNIAKVGVINDLESNAYGLHMLEEDEFLTIHAGQKKTGNQALLAAGTGLGEACLYWDGKGYHPFACEGGHSDFAPRDELEMELLRYLKKQFGHVSYERVLSGSGLYQLYRFLIDMQLEKETAEMRQKFATIDPPQVITQAAIEGTCHVCIRVVRWFLSIYGSEAGNVALKFLSLGGVYIGGGIAPRLKEFIGKGEFLRGFTDKGRFRPLLEEMTIKIVLNDNAALLGALRYAREWMR